MVLYLGEVTDENNVLLVLLTHVFVWHFHSHFDDLISPFNSAVQLLGVPEWKAPFNSAVQLLGVPEWKAPFNSAVQLLGVPEWKAPFNSAVQLLGVPEWKAPFNSAVQLLGVPEWKAPFNSAVQLLGVPEWKATVGNPDLCRSVLHGFTCAHASFTPRNSSVLFWFNSRSYLCA